MFTRTGKNDSELQICGARGGVAASGRRGSRLFAAYAAILIAAVWFAAFPVRAAESGILMSTTYPGLKAKAGSSLSFSLDFDNATGAAVDATLATKAIPEDWSGYFEGNGSEISHIFLKEDENDSAATYRLSIPDDCAAGEYEVVLTASAGNETSTLTLNLDVSEEELGTSELTTEYAEQEGASGTSFSFTSTIRNNSSEAQSYSLSSEAPAGWQVKITPSGDSTQIASIDVDAQGSQGLSISVTPPETVEAGDYTIPVSAISAAEVLSTDLKITITGTYGVALSTPSQRLSFDAEAGRQTAVTLTVTNSGNVDLQNVNLTSTPPTDWTVEFSESTIDVLEAGATKEVTAYVTPASNALSGDYQLTLTAKTNETENSAAFRVTVKTATTWGIVGIALIAIVAACLVFVMKRFGRH